MYFLPPGGVREAYFSHDYSMLWGKRVGFAKIALESQVVGRLWDVTQKLWTCGPNLTLWTQAVCLLTHWRQNTMVYI